MSTQGLIGDLNRLAFGKDKIEGPPPKITLYLFKHGIVKSDLSDADRAVIGQPLCMSVFFSDSDDLSSMVDRAKGANAEIIETEQAIVVMCEPMLPKTVQLKR